MCRNGRLGCGAGVMPRAGLGAARTGGGGSLADGMATTVAAPRARGADARNWGVGGWCLGASTLLRSLLSSASGSLSDRLSAQP